MSAGPASLAQAWRQPRHWPRECLRGLVLGYRFFLSPWLGSACRFEPTCSRYALEALSRHGAAAGSYLAAARILRCHPACSGGCDPVPAQRPRLFRHLFAEATQPLPPVAATEADTPASAPAAMIDPLTSSRP